MGTSKSHNRAKSWGIVFAFVLVPTTVMAKPGNAGSQAVTSYAIDPLHPAAVSVVGHGSYDHPLTKADNHASRVILRNPIGVNDPDPIPSKKPVAVVSKPLLNTQRTSAKTKGKTGAPVSAPQVANNSAAKDTNRVSFTSLNVSGNVKEPRVDFATERLEATRVDEFRQIDMMQRIKSDPTTQSLSH